MKVKVSRVLTSRETDAIGRKIKSKCLNFSKSTLDRGRKVASRVKV